MNYLVEMFLLRVVLPAVLLFGLSWVLIKITDKKHK